EVEGPQDGPAPGPSCARKSLSPDGSGHKGMGSGVPSVKGLLLLITLPPRASSACSGVSSSSSCRFRFSIFGFCSSDMGVLISRLSYAPPLSYLLAASRPGLPGCLQEHTRSPPEARKVCRQCSSRRRKGGVRH